MVRVWIVVAALLAAGGPAFAAPASPAALDTLYQKLWGDAAAAATKHAPTVGSGLVLQRVAKMLSERYGVQVIRAERTQLNGKPVFEVVVINPGGDFNEAYAVHTLVVDASTGTLISQFEHLPSGYDLASPPDRTPRDDGSAVVLRRETFSKL